MLVSSATGAEADVENVLDGRAGWKVGDEDERMGDGRDNGSATIDVEHLAFEGGAVDRIDHLNPFCGGRETTHGEKGLAVLVPHESGHFATNAGIPQERVDFVSGRFGRKSGEEKRHAVYRRRHAFRIWNCREEVGGRWCRGRWAIDEETSSCATAVEMRTVSLVVCEKDG